MHDHTTPRDATARPPAADGRLVRLADLDDYRVADGDPDVRGWDVRTRRGRWVGKVGGLLVDTRTMTVRYLDVRLDAAALDLDGDRHVLVPIGGARLAADADAVIAEMSQLQLLSLADHRDGLQARFFGERRAGRERSPYLVRVEDAVDVDNRRAAGGDVEVRRRVAAEARPLPAGESVTPAPAGDHDEAVPAGQRTEKDR